MATVMDVIELSFSWAEYNFTLNSNPQNQPEIRKKQKGKPSIFMYKPKLQRLDNPKACSRTTKQTESYM